MNYKLPELAVATSLHHFMLQELWTFYSHCLGHFAFWTTMYTECTILQRLHKHMEESYDNFRYAWYNFMHLQNLNLEDEFYCKMCKQSTHYYHGWYLFDKPSIVVGGHFFLINKHHHPQNLVDKCHYHYCLFKSKADVIMANILWWLMLGLSFVFLLRVDFCWKAPLLLKKISSKGVTVQKRRAS